MARLAFVSLLVLIPIVLSAPAEEKDTEKKGRSLVYPGTVPVGGAAASGAAGAQYGQQVGGSETHDKKNFGLNFSSDKGSSNNYSNTNAAAGAAGSVAQGLGVGGYPYNYYPQYQYPSYPPAPIYPSVYPGHYPVSSGYPVVGTGSGVQLPGGLNAQSSGGVGPYGVPIRY